MKIPFLKKPSRFATWTPPMILVTWAAISLFVSSSIDDGNRDSNTPNTRSESTASSSSNATPTGTNGVLNSWAVAEEKSQHHAKIDPSQLLGRSNRPTHPASSGHSSHELVSARSPDRITETATQLAARFGMNGPVRLEDVPAGRFRQQVEKLPAQARENALKNLAKHQVPLLNVDSINADSAGELFYACFIEGCNHHSDAHALEQSESSAASPGEPQSIPEGSTGPDGGTASASGFNPSAAVPISSPPVFHSLPGATNVLYLDFNGGNITNTQWNYGRAETLVCRPYDLDGDPATLSIAEQRLIHDAWKRVAEDFAPFQIDITTEQPAQWTSTTGHVMITPEVDANGVNLPHIGNGGVAYLNVFGTSNYSYNTPTSASSPVWAQSYGNLNTGDAGTLAQVISHEFGHNFSLNHHGFGPNTYYDGHSATSEAPSWGPIMGTAWSGNLTQWTDGEYFSATNPGQDDLERIRVRTAYRDDDHGDTPANPSELNDTAFTVEGMIAHTGDVDVFAIPSGGGTLSVSVEPHRMLAGSWGTNLDVLLEIYDQSGAVIASSNPLADANASVSLNVPEGTYYAYVKPTGAGNPLSDPPSGYTVYGSRGSYVLSGTSTTPGGETSPAITQQPVGKTIGVGQDYPLSVTATGGYGLKYQWRKNGLPIPGAGFSTLRLNPSSLADTGSYDVVVSNSLGSVTSTAAQLTVVAQKVDAGPDQYVFLTGGTPWTPADVAALAWYDASDAGSVSASGGAVSAWNDKTTNNRHLTQATAASQPAYANNTVFFDGMDDHLFRSDAFMHANGQVDVFMIGSVPTGQTDARIITEGSGSSNTPIYCIAQTGFGQGGQMRAYIRNSSEMLASSFGPSDAYDGTSKLYQWRDTGSRVSGRIFGGSDFSVDYTRSETITLNRFAIGAWLRSSAASFKSANINEIVICSNLSDADRQRMEGYLAHKWDMSLSLPSGHPYRSAPPVIGAVATVTLNGTVGAAESGSLTTLWSKVDGPGTVNFDNTSAVDTTATITTEGIYQLKLAASDADEFYEDHCQLIVIPFTETYTVSYDGNGQDAGSPPASQTKIKGIDLTLSTNSGLIKTGHTLSGWNTSADGTGTHYPAGGTYTLNAPATLYAEWTPVTSTVTFNRNNGSVPNPSTKLVSYGATYGNLPVSIRIGYTFDGWFTELEGGSEVTAATVVTATDDHTLYARWTIITYPVTYSANGATSGTAPESQIKTYNQTLTLASNGGELVKTGALFFGWNTAADGLGTNYAEGASYFTNAPLSLFAKWVNQATVTFNKQGGSGGSDSVLATTTYAMPAATAPTRAGYNFTGYFTEPAGAGTQYYTAAMASARTWDIATDTTLHAHWTADPTPPSVASFNPVDGATSVSIASNLTVNFTEPVMFGSGSITILRSLDGVVVESYDVTNPGSKLSISGNTLTINPTGNLPHSAACHVLISAGAILDFASNPFAGISDPTIWNFTTAAEVLLADIFTGSTAVSINENLSTRQSGSMAPSTYTVEAGSDQKMSSSKLKTVSGQRVANDADFEAALKTSGLTGFTLSFQLDNDGNSWVSSYLSTHNLTATDDRGESRFGMHLSQNGSSTALTAYGDSGTGQSTTTLSKTTLESLLGTTFAANVLNTFTLVATPTSTTAGTYDLFVNGVEALSNIPYLIGNGGSNGKVSWESHNNSGTAYIDNLSISQSPNRAPVWSSNPITGTEATEGQAYSGTLAGLATDLDGQNLNYALVSTPTWLSVASNGTLSGTPGPTQTGPNSFTVSVTDGISTVQATLNINVIAVTNPSYTVTYDGNGNSAGTVPTDATSPYDANASVTVLSEGDLVKSGHTFAGWNTAANGSGTGYQATNTFSISSNTPLFAQWTPNTYTVSFNANGGSTPSPTNTSVTYGSTYGTLATTSRTGYTFIGWFTAASGGNEVTTLTSVSTASSHTLYAQWINNNIPQTLTASPTSVDGIIGLAQESAEQPGYYLNYNSGRAGGAGSIATLTRLSSVPVVGFTLPTLPAGHTVDSVTLHYQITSYRYEGNPTFTADTYLLNTSDPSTSGAGFYYMGANDPNASVKRIGSTDLPDGATSTNITADPVIAVSQTLSGDALSTFMDFYSGNAPTQPEAFLRFNRSNADNPDLSNNQVYERFTITTSAANLYLEITTSPPDTTPPTLASTDIVDNANGEPVGVNVPVTYTLTFSKDIDDSTVTAADFGNAGTASVNIGSINESSPGVFTVQVTPTTVGTLQLRVNASAVITDILGNALDTTSPILDDTIITVTDDNLPPSWASGTINGGSITAMQSYQGTLADDASDPNNDDLIFAKVSGPPWLVVASNGTLSGVPAAENVGPNTFTVSVTDNINAPVQATLNITVQAASGWYSELYPENWQRPDATASFYNDKIIQDFSYAGYKRGEEAVPNVTSPVFDVTDYGAVPNTADDSTAAIQATINAASAAGGGVVRLPAGTFRISPQGGNSYGLLINSPNIVLRGAGAGNTFLLNTETNMRSKDIIRVSSSVSTAASSLMTQDLEGPTRRLPVATPGSFAVGDVVRLEWTFTDAWIADHGQQAFWSEAGGSPGTSRILREVTDVNVGEGWIEIDIPTRYTMRMRDSARVVKVNGLISNIGIEAFSIANVQHPGTGFGESDYTVSGTAAYDCHNSYVIEMSNVRDCWIGGVHSYQPAGNTTTCHMLSNGILLSSSTRVTVSDCAMRRPQSGGGGGNGYMFRLTNASDSLIKNCVADFSRHGIVTSHSGTTGNVFLQCEDHETARATGSSGSYTTGGSGSDNHMFFSHSNLWDSCHAHNSFYTAHHRGNSGGTPHALTSAHGVYWNTSGSGTRYANSSNPIVRSEQSRYGYVIGTRTTDANNAYFASNPTGSNTAPADHLEGLGTGSTLYPSSLYLDQLSRRLEPAVTYFANGATNGSVPFDANNPYAPGATVAVSSVGDLTRAGFSFTGWNTSADGSGRAYAPGDTFTIDDRVALYAQWLGASYTVSFDANGGTTADPISISVNFGSPYGTLANTSRAGYTFAGWFTAAIGGEQITSESVVTIADNHTVYAQWANAELVGVSLRHYIRGESEDGTATIGYISSTQNVVGTSGATGSRDDRNVVFGFPLPTLPVGATLDSAVFNFEITQARDSTGGANLPELHAYLLNTSNPVGSGSTFYYHGALDPNTNAKRVGITSTSIDVNSDVNYTAGEQSRSFTLSGDALNLLKAFYNGNTPTQSVAYFRFNLSVDPALTTYRRYRVSTAADASSLQLIYNTPANNAPVWSFNPLSKPNATEGSAYSGSLAADASDTEDDDLIFAKVSGPDWLNIATDGTLSGTPTSVGDSPNAFVVSVRDAFSTPVQTTLNIPVLSAFDAWVDANDSSGVTFGGDANNDGLADGMAWLLGASLPSQNAGGLQPKIVASSSGLVMDFKMLNATSRGSATLQLQYSNDLGINDPWTNHTVTIPETSGTVGGVEFVITPVEGTDLNQVQATVPESATGGSGKVFVRLMAGSSSP